MNDQPENKFVEIIIITLGFALVIWKVWPIMRANNIFNSTKPRYARRRLDPYDQSKRYPSLTPVQLLLASSATGMAGTLLSVYRYIQIDISTPVYSAVYKDNSTAIMLFVYSLLMLLATFVVNTTGEWAFSEQKNFTYIIKVWLTSLFTAPVISISSFFFIHGRAVFSVENTLSAYFTLVILMNGFGTLTFGILVLLVNYVSRKQWQTVKKRLYILLTAESMIISSIGFLAALIQAGSFWFIILIPFTLIIGLAIWYYKFDQTVITDETFKAAETVD